jgi:hypothetical protein
MCGEDERLTMGLDKSPKISHSSDKVLSPMYKTVKRPTNLTLIAPAMKTPVRLNQNHHTAVNDLKLFQRKPKSTGHE